VRAEEKSVPESRSDEKGVTFPRHATNRLWKAPENSGSTTKWLSGLVGSEERRGRTVKRKQN
jgi:hypothetical protein